VIPALALGLALAIVAQDHTRLGAAPRGSALVLTELPQGDVLEVRGERADYLQVYDYRLERGGYVKRVAVRPVGLDAGQAPALLAIVRFLRDSPGAEPLGISYAAAYLRAVPSGALTAEPFDAIGAMAERLADRSSGAALASTDLAAHLQVVEQFGVHLRSIERNGRIRLCYDGELYRRVLSMPGADAEVRARAALALTRPDCIDPGLGPLPRAALDEQRASLLDAVDEHALDALARSRLHARRAAVWAAVAYARSRSASGIPASAAGQRALEELLDVDAAVLGEDRRAEYADAVVRVAAARWAAEYRPATDARQITQAALRLRSERGAPGETCVVLENAQRAEAPWVRRCTYGLVWLASARAIGQGRALVLAVQPLESWRELWVFHRYAGRWRVDVLSPGTEEPEEGYVEFAGVTPRARRLLTVREVKEHGHFRRRFEEYRLADLALVAQASSPELLPDFGRWADAGWRRETLSLR